MKNSDKFIAVIEQLMNETKFEAGRNYVLHIGIKQGEISACAVKPFDAQPQLFEKPVLTANYLVEQHACL